MLHEGKPWRLARTCPPLRTGTRTQKKTCRCHVIRLHLLTLLSPVARPSQPQLPRPPCSVAVRVVIPLSQRWRAAAVARLVRVALSPCTCHCMLPLTPCARPSRCYALRVAVWCSSRRAHLLWRCVCARVWWKEAPLPAVALTLPCAFCQALRADLLTACGVRGGVSVKMQCAPTLPVRHTLTAWAACANPNLSLRRACASIHRRRRLTLSPSWRS